MDSISATNDVQSTKALAHKLYCQCQIPTSPYRPLARSVRSVRNKLEEADDALNEVALRPEEIRVLYAVDASKNVLEKLDNLLQKADLGTIAHEEIPLHYYIDAFANWINVALKELSDAIDSLERSAGRTDMLSNTPIYTSAQPTPVDTPISFASSHQWNTSARRYNSDRASLTDATSIRSSGAGSVVSSSRDMHNRSVGQKPQSGLNDIRRMSSNTADSWRSPFASPDPMSIDIDAASSMILSERPIALPDKQTYLSSHANEWQFTSPCDGQSSARASEAPEAVLAPLVQTGDDDVHESKETELQRSLAMFFQRPMQSNTERPETGAIEMDSNVTRLGERTDKKCTYGWPIPSLVRMEPETRVSQPEGRASTPPAVVSPVSGSKQPATATRERYYRGVPKSPADVNNPQSGRKDSERIAPKLLPGPESDGPTDMAIASSGAFRVPLVESQARRLALTQIRHVPRAASEDLRKSGRHIGLGISGGTRAQVVGDRHLDRSGKNSPPTSDSSLSSSQQRLTSKRQVTANLQDARERLSARHADLDLNLDKEQVAAITECWNKGRWNEVETWIQDALKKIATLSDACNTTRRLRHLQGVSASLNGEWERALSLFLSVLQTPLCRPGQLDEGDCVAAIWLGHTYALLGRNAEALLSYTIAEQGSLLQGADAYQLNERVRVERTTCQKGLTKSNLNLRTHRAIQKSHLASDNSIFNAEILTTDAAKAFLDTIDWTRLETTLDPSQSRATALCDVGLKSESLEEMHKLELKDSAFTPSSPWPLPFDPFFNIANTSTTTSSPCDLLEKIDTKNPPKIAKAAALSRKGMNSFTCQDLKWLITKLRECLTRLEISYTEHTNDQETWIDAAYNSFEGKGSVATKVFFTITFFRLTFRSGFGAEVCNFRSARVRSSEPGIERGVPLEEVKKIKRRVKEFLDRELMRHEAKSLEGTVMPVMSVNGGIHRRVSISANRGNSRGFISNNGSGSPASPRPGSLL
ncbi:hypothetical protein HII31_05160 [Pseudocercospora fuligena]|uniref:Uncharacterized protein n=1 Tax=Pseudocercospora fuligena TaxID=685502 RepID=A0A8H6RJA8_9PEZI|nr:hypothetical protein HII31_05160 [Pseudocercospora fuligena]